MPKKEDRIQVFVVSAQLGCLLGRVGRAFGRWLESAFKNEVQQALLSFRIFAFQPPRKSRNQHSHWLSQWNPEIKVWTLASLLNMELPKVSSLAIWPSKTNQQTKVYTPPKNSHASPGKYFNPWRKEISGPHDQHLQFLLPLAEWNSGNVLASEAIQGDDVRYHPTWHANWSLRVHQRFPEISMTVSLPFGRRSVMWLVSNVHFCTSLKSKYFLRSGNKK